MVDAVVWKKIMPFFLLQIMVVLACNELHPYLGACSFEKNTAAYLAENTLVGILERLLTLSQV